MISVFLTPLTQRNLKQQAASKKLRILAVISDWKRTKSKLSAKLILLYLLPTVSSALRSFTPGQLDSFRVQAAKLALSSMLTYDPHKKVLPSTHAFNNLQRLNRVRRLRLNIVHIPEGKAYKQYLVLQKQMQMLDSLGRLPTLLLLADLTGISQDKLLKLLNRSSIINDSAANSDITGQSTFYTKAVSDKDFILYTYASVGPVLKKIMLWSLGIKGQPMLSNLLIAHKLKISPGAVSQRKMKINNMLMLLRGLI